MKKENLILPKLTEIQRQLDAVNDEQLPILQAVINTVFKEQMLDQYGERSILIHSLSSFILNQQLGIQEDFNELYHIGQIDTFDIVNSPQNKKRALHIVFDAEVVANPPDPDLQDFEPFYKCVNVPVIAIEEIKAA